MSTPTARWCRYGRARSCGSRGRLSKRPECGAHFAREEFRLFPSGKVTALVDLVEVGDVGVRVLDPAARSPPDLAGEGGEADRERDLGRSLAGLACLSLGLSVLPVRPGRRVAGARQPVQRDVVDDVVPGEIAHGL